MAALCLLLLGMPCFLSATTYRLKRVSQVEAGSMYVFEQNRRVMTGSVDKSGAVQTTPTFSYTALEGTESYVWNLTASGAGYKMKASSGNFLANSSSTTMTTNSTGSVWAFNFQEDGTVLIQNTSYANRYLGYAGTATYQYKAYSADDLSYPHDISVYQLVEETESLKNPVLQFAKNVAPAVVGTSFTPPVLSKDDSFDGTVTYSSSNTSVATVDPSTGVVTLVAPGMAKIIASSAATANYQADETFYSLRVYDGDGTAEHPYSLRDVFSNTFDTTIPFYLSGYVVGSFVSPTKVSTTASDDETLAIADAAGETTLSQMKMVYLEGDRRSAYGLKSHPDMLGNRIVVRGKDYTYMANTAVGNVTSLSATRDVTISSACYATVGASYAMDYSGTDVRAYSAGVSGGKVELSLITDGIVPANQGTILYCATPGTYAVPVTTETGTCSNTGLGISDGSSATGSNLYVLASRSGTVGFYRWTSDSSLPKGRVYLDAAAGAPEYLAFSFGQTTDVERVTPAQPKVDEGTVYNLQGQRVERPVRGLYIMGGRKVLVK